MLPFELLCLSVEQHSWLHICMQSNWTSTACLPMVIGLGCSTLTVQALWSIMTLQPGFLISQAG